MNEVTTTGAGKVSGNQASILANVRRAFGIEDGDLVRWRVAEDELKATLVHRKDQAFADLEPGASDQPLDIVDDHDRFGVAYPMAPQAASGFNASPGRLLRATVAS